MLYELRNFLAENPAFFAFLRKLIELNFQKQKALIGSVIGQAGNPGKVLDIGCGTGEFSPLFAESDYCGIDISPAYINYAKKKMPGDFRLMDATSLKFPDNNFDFILIMATLHHMDDKTATSAIKEAARVLKAGGKMLVLEDAKIDDLENFIVRFVQKFDKGEFIRIPEDYEKLVYPFFSISERWRFRNGGCVYYSMLLGKKYG